MKSQWTAADMRSQAGRRFMVTGATNGIGLETARALANSGAHVILAVRNVELGHQRAAEIGGSTEVMHVDLADLSSVRRFAESLTDDVDVLINNAGAISRRREETVDGFELLMGTNFLGPFALTNLIFPRVRERIVIVGSNAHKASRLDMTDLNVQDRRWGPWRAYAQSKMADMLWGLELDRRLRAARSPVDLMIAHPGWAATQISSQTGKPKLDRVLFRISAAFANDDVTGAGPTLYAATEPIAPGSYVGPDRWGDNIGGPHLAGRAAAAGDFALAARLCDWAEQQTGTTLPV